MGALDPQTTLSQNLSQFAARKLNRSRAAREELFPSAQDWCETKQRMRGNGGPERRALLFPMTLVRAEDGKELQLFDPD
jgi:hypothetical protein